MADQPRIAGRARSSVALFQLRVHDWTDRAKVDVNRSARRRVSRIGDDSREGRFTHVVGGLPVARVALDHELDGARNRTDGKIIWLRPRWRAAAERAAADTARN